MLQTLTSLGQEVDQGGFAWTVTDDVAMLLKVSYKDLYRFGSAQTTVALQQFKAQFEQQFLQLDSLPTGFQDAFRRDWLAAVYLQLAEAIKSDRRLADLFQINLMLDTQERVQNLEALVQDLVSRFDAPQPFLEIVQPGVQVDIEGLRSDIQTLRQDLLDRFDESDDKADQRHGEVVGLLKDRMPQVPAVSIVIDQGRPRVEHWQGRGEELAQLQGWIDEANLIGISGLGGYGKSALADRLYERQIGSTAGNRTGRFDQGIWVTLSQPYNFSEWGRWLLGQLGMQLEEKAPDQDLINALVKRLSAMPTLVVLDNLETLLQQDGTWQMPSYQQFLLKWLEQGHNSTLLVTTREQPQLLVNPDRWCRLAGLKPAEGEQLLRKRGIQGSTADLQQFVELADGHPLLLNLAASLLMDRFGSQPDITRRDADLNLFEIVGLHHGDPETNVGKLFTASLERLEPQWQELLLNLTVSLAF